jgi:Protein of unknown function (DUF1501)
MTMGNFGRAQPRRRFLQQCASGLGMIALRHLLAEDARADEGLADVNPLKPRPSHFPAKAKNVIFLFMAGGPSHIDLFDPKPSLMKWDGQALPESMSKNLNLAFIKPTAKIWPSPRTFRHYGACGTEFSDLIPHVSSCADDICLIRSMYTEQINHHPGQLMMNCGSQLVGRPSMGAWVTYGLGSESQNLPGFVVLSSGGGTSAGSGNWGSGFLPSSYQGVPFRSVGDPVLYLSNPPAISKEAQRERLNLLRDLNEAEYQEAGDPEITARIASYELAFRMQAAAPELLDLSKETPATLEMYGINRESSRPFAANCLLARRLIERGVRFVELFHDGWDHHSDLNSGLKKQCEMTDQPTAALLKDLKQRGLLDSTLLIWGGEFGRTPMVENRRPDGKDSQGRDHHRLAFSMWVAGGGIKGGQAIGTTDELGFNIVEDKVDVHDFHATLLHCLGLDHKRLTFRHQGRDFRLTDVAGELAPKLLA